MPKQKISPLIFGHYRTIEYNLRHRHGFGLSIKKQRLQSQGNQCAGCGKVYDPSDETLKAWHVDHDHHCKRHSEERSCEHCQRGILCRRCNNLLGIVRDNPKILRQLADYLEAHGFAL